MQHAAAWLEPQPLDKSFMVLEGMGPGIADAVTWDGWKSLQKLDEWLKMRFSKSHFIILMNCCLSAFLIALATC